MAGRISGSEKPGHRPATIAVKIRLLSGVQSLHAVRQTRDLARCGVAVQHALGRGALQFRLGSLKSGLSLGSVAEAMASSTLRMKLRTRERRDLLISVRRAILRVAFFAEVVLAIDASLRIRTKLRHCRRSLRPIVSAMQEHFEAVISFPNCGRAYNANAGRRQRAFFPGFRSFSIRRVDAGRQRRRTSSAPPAIRSTWPRQPGVAQGAPSRS